MARPPFPGGGSVSLAVNSDPADPILVIDDVTYEWLVGDVINTLGFAEAGWNKSDEQVTVVEVISEANVRVSHPDWSGGAPPTDAGGGSFNTISLVGGPSAFLPSATAGSFHDREMRLKKRRAR